MTIYRYIRVRSSFKPLALVYLQWRRMVKRGKGSPKVCWCPRAVAWEKGAVSGLPHLWPEKIGKFGKITRANFRKFGKYGNFAPLEKVYLRLPQMKIDFKKYLNSWVSVVKHLLVFYLIIASCAVSFFHHVKISF